MIPAPPAPLTPADGWWRFALPRQGGFDDIFEPIEARAEEGGRVRCRVPTGRGQQNPRGTIHGGFLLAFLDESLFVTAMALHRIGDGGAVTLNAALSFIGAGVAGEPLDALIEIVGETGRMLFLRGLMVQGTRTLASFEATLRKLDRRVAPE